MTEWDSAETSFCEPMVRIVLHKTLPHSHAVNRHADVLNMVLLRDTFRSFKWHVSRYLEPVGNLGKIEGEHDFRRHPEKVSATDCPVTISQKEAIEAGGSRISPSLMPRDSRDAVMLHILAISFAVRPFSRFLTSIILAIYEVLI